MHFHTFPFTEILNLFGKELLQCLYHPIIACYYSYKQRKARYVLGDDEDSSVVTLLLSFINDLR